MRFNRLQVWNDLPFQLIEIPAISVGKHLWRQIGDFSPRLWALKLCTSMNNSAACATTSGSSGVKFTWLLP
jgi:hypothetical protein